MSTFKTNTIAFWENFQQKEAEIIRLFENNQPEKNSRNGSLERSQKKRCPPSRVHLFYSSNKR